MKFWYFVENPNFWSMIFWRLWNNLSKIHDSSSIVGGRVFFDFLVVENVVIAVVVDTEVVFFVVSSGQVAAWSEQQSRKSWHDESQKQSRPFIFAPIFDFGRFQIFILEKFKFENLSEKSLKPTNSWSSQGIPSAIMLGLHSSQWRSTPGQQWSGPI